jgi:hypothetical protein
MTVKPNQLPGWTFRGCFFPEGTQLRAKYKKQTYTALIKEGAWRDANGSVARSPSDAAVKITGTKVNGWTFWEYKLPGDTLWKRLSAMRMDEAQER